MCVEAEGKWNQNLTEKWNQNLIEINIRIYLILFLSRLIYRSTSLRFFLSIFGSTLLISRCVRFKSAHTSETLIMKNSRSIAGNVFYFWKYLLLDATDFHTAHLPRNISASGGQNFLLFFFRTWCRSRTPGIHGKTERCAWSPWERFLAECIRQLTFAIIWYCTTIS